MDTCYKLKRNGERLRLLRRSENIGTYECLDRPMSRNCKGEMKHPRLIISDVRLREIAVECKYETNR